MRTAQSLLTLVNHMQNAHEDNHHHGGTQGSVACMAGFSLAHVLIPKLLYVGPHQNGKVHCLKNARKRVCVCAFLYGDFSFSFCLYFSWLGCFRAKGHHNVGFFFKGVQCFALANVCCRTKNRFQKLQYSRKRKLTNVLFIINRPRICINVS